MSSFRNVKTRTSLYLALLRSFFEIAENAVILYTELCAGDRYY